jgi:hypothetical protein
VINLKVREKLIEIARDLNPEKHIPDTANVGVVMGFILAGLIMVIGVIVFSSLDTSIHPMVNSSCSALTGSACMRGVYGWNTTLDSLVGNALSGYNLLGVMLIVLAAAGIIAVLLLSMMRGRQE